MKYRILIIGGTGVLSTDVVTRSLLQGHTVYILNRGNNSCSIPTEAVLLKADIKDTAGINEIIKDLHFDVVVDFISYTITDIKNSLALFQKKCRQFIFISSACVYRRAKEDGCITEDSPLINPNWSYSVNKVECEKYLISHCTATGLKYTIVRPYITYGNTRIPYGIMPQYGWHWTLIARLLNNKPIILWDRGEAVCTLTHTAEFAKGVVGLYCNGKAYNEAFHIVGDERFTWREVAVMIGKIVDTNVITIEIPSDYIAKKLPELKGMLLGDRSIDAVFDNSKIKAAVPEFICTTSAAQGISQTIDYYRDNNYLHGIDYRWDAQMDRLIHDYLKSGKSAEISQANIGFIDYSSASRKDKVIYYQYRYLPKCLMRVTDLVFKMLNYLGCWRWLPSVK